jgi:O-antigen ligase
MDPGRALQIAALLVAGAAVLAAVAVRPEVAALVTLVLVTVVPIDTLFTYDLPFLSGGLKVTDLLLLACLGSWVARQVVDPHPIRLPSRPVTVLVLGLVALGGVGVLTARSNGVELKFALLELRAFLALLLVFPIVDGVRRIEDLRRAVAVFLVATAVSSVVITRDFLNGRGTAALFAGDALRVNNLVYLYPLAGIVWAFALMPWIRDRRRWLLFGLAGICAAGLFFTARRGGWVVALLAPLAVAALVSPARRRGLLRVLVGIALAATVAIAVTNELSSHPIRSPLSSARERLFSVDEGDADVSTGHRLAEIRAARKLIADNPVTGIGLGATITFVSPLYDPTTGLSDVPTTNNYVHDSFLFVALKMGLIALGVFVALLGVTVRDAYVGYRAATDPVAERLMLGGFLTLLALIAISFTEPHLTYVGSAPLFAAAIALTQIVPRLERDQAADPG